MHNVSYQCVRSESKSKYMICFVCRADAMLPCVVRGLEIEPTDFVRLLGVARGGVLVYIVASHRHREATVAFLLLYISTEGFLLYRCVYSTVMGQPEIRREVTNGTTAARKGAKSGPGSWR